MSRLDPGTRLDAPLPLRRPGAPRSRGDELLGWLGLLTVLVVGLIVALGGALVVARLAGWLR